MAKIYLSLDLDFFNAHNMRSPRAFLSLVELHLNRVADFVHRWSLPCVAVTNHQQMLPFVNDSGCDVLLNVDTHSDLAEKDITDFSCGTWVSYVSWRKHGKYLWHHGDRVDAGECAWPRPLFNPRPSVRRGEMAGWKHADHRRSKQMPRLTESITAVGVCWSPSYVASSDDTGALLRGWAKKNGIRFLKGRLDEHFSVRRRPPE